MGICSSAQSVMRTKRAKESCVNRDRNQVAIERRWRSWFRTENGDRRDGGGGGQGGGDGGGSSISRTSKVGSGVRGRDRAHSTSASLGATMKSDSAMSGNWHPSSWYESAGHNEGRHRDVWKFAPVLNRTPDFDIIWISRELDQQRCFRWIRLQIPRRKTGKLRVSKISI